MITHTSSLLSLLLLPYFFLQIELSDSSSQKDNLTSAFELEDCGRTGKVGLFVPCPLLWNQKLTVHPKGAIACWKLSTS